ncbi:MAG: hypothetical protein ACTS3R_07435 [Inquilinaceae bacterium]
MEMTIKFRLLALEKIVGGLVEGKGVPPEDVERWHALAQAQDLEVGKLMEIADKITKAIPPR